MKTYTTYAIPFISNHEISKTLYWTLYDDRSGGMFHTVDEVAPLASLLYLDDCKRVWEYLTLHRLILEGGEVQQDPSKKDYIKALANPVKTNIEIPKIVW